MGLARENAFGTMGVSFRLSGSAVEGSALGVGCIQIGDAGCAKRCINLNIRHDVIHLGLIRLISSQTLLAASVEARFPAESVCRLVLVKFEI